MSRQDNGRDKKQFLTLKKIKWAAITVPIILLASLDLMRHNFFFAPLHSLAGFIVTYVALGVGVAIFSQAVFGLIERLQRQNDERNRHLQALNEIAKVSASDPSLDDVLRASLDTVLSTMKVESGLICLVDLEKEEHSAACYQGISPDFVHKIQRAKIKDDLIAHDVVRTGKPVIIERVLEDSRVTEAAKQAGIKSMISAPLKSEGEVNGILAIATRTERSFSEADQDFLEGIGGQLGMAIRNATLYEETRLQNRELNALLGVGKVSTSSLNLDELLGRSLDTILEVTRTDAGEFWLAETDGMLVLQCHRGAHRESFLEKTRFLVGEGIPGLVAQSRQPFVTHNLASDANFWRQKVTEAGFRTFCALPVVFQNKLIGVLAVAAFSADALSGHRELRLLESIGEWLALAIENARLYRQVQDLAVVHERERMAREMHDGMAQLLGYINAQTIGVSKFISDGKLAEAQKELAKMQDITRDLYADVREGILALRTTTQRKDGLISSLREYVERFTDLSGVQVKVEVGANAERPSLDAGTEIQLMRIVQEALTNVRKHSGATGAVLICNCDDGHFQTIIADDGHGFDPANLPNKGWPRFGLQTMRERAEAVGGTLQIETAPGQGTKVSMRVPLSGRGNGGSGHESASG